MSRVTASHQGWQKRNWRENGAAKVPSRSKGKQNETSQKKKTPTAQAVSSVTPQVFCQRRKGTQSNTNDLATLQEYRIWGSREMTERRTNTKGNIHDSNKVKTVGEIRGKRGTMKALALRK